MNTPDRTLKQSASDLSETMDSLGFTTHGKTRSGLSYAIEGEFAPVTTFQLPPHTTLIVDPSAFQHRSAAIEVETIGTGFMKDLKRTFAGESFRLQKYSSGHRGGELAIRATSPGLILPVTLKAGETLMANSGAFLAAEESVTLDTKSPGLLKGLVGEGNLFFQKLTGPGTVFVNLGGHVSKRELSAGEKLVVESGNVGMFLDSVDYNIQRVEGLGNILFGQGFYNTTLEGPGTVYIQSMTPALLARELGKFMPPSRS